MKKYGVLLLFALLCVATPYASTFPDGLEKVAESLGFIDRAITVPLITAVMPDYAFPNTIPQWWHGVLVALLGGSVCYCFAVLLGKVFRRTATR